MSERELASARSFWKRKQLRAGRWSRNVEVKEMSPDTVRADAMENGLVDDVVAILGTGKEADVYLGSWREAYLVLKVYRLHRTPHKKKATIGYALDHVGAVAAKEFTTLQKAYEAGVPVPTPARRVDNMFTMRFIGDGVMAPQLKDTTLEFPEQMAAQAIELVERLLEAYIVHGDLSEYNILVWKQRLFVIDFPQAIDFSSRRDRHIKVEEAKPLLLRDLRNLERYFKRYSVEVDSANEYERMLLKLESFN